jgi:hypothetical protein
VHAHLHAGSFLRLWVLLSKATRTRNCNLSNLARDRRWLTHRHAMLMAQSRSGTNRQPGTNDTAICTPLMEFQMGWHDGCREVRRRDPCPSRTLQLGWERALPLGFAFYTKPRHSDSTNVQPARQHGSDHSCAAARQPGVVGRSPEPAIHYRARCA